jgi:predicted dehydrogenase
VERGNGRRAEESGRMTMHLALFGRRQKEGYPMKRINRREFLKASLAGAGASAALPALSWARVLGANDDVRVAVIGVRGKGNHHIQMLRDIEGVRVVALCDADREVLDKRILEWEKPKEKLAGYTDIRKLLENKDIDAVSIATPNHWHALGTIWACQAGKDVYVEKPVSHNIWEGRKMVEAARKYKRIVQAGTQKRSMPGLQEAFAAIRGGELGKILWARGFCYKRRESIGKVDGPQEPPVSVDYDLWTGPAPLKPMMRRNLHYDWHWVWDTGNGDLGNQGIHEMDLARWALGEEKMPPRVFSVGGRFGYDDDGETANTQIAYLDYPNAPLIFEVRGLPMGMGMKAMDHYRSTRIGIVVQCADGYFVGGDSGGWFHDGQGKKIRQFKSGGAGGHHANWLKAVRSRRAEELTADIEKCHVSSSLCHMANISHRLGKNLAYKKVAKKVKKYGEAADSYKRFLAHLEKNEIDLKDTDITLGPVLGFDPEEERFTGGHGKDANELATRRYRVPFTIGDKV